MKLTQWLGYVSLAAIAGLGFGAGQALPGHPWMAAVQAEDTSVDRALDTAVAEDMAQVRAVRSTLPAVVSLSHGDDSGSGIIIDRRGVILTNAHVVEGTRRVTVSLSDGRTLEGTVLAADDTRDMAVVQVRGSDLPTAMLGNSDDLAVGQTAIAIGDPLGLDRSVTRGVISGVNRSPDDLDLSHLIQTDAAINPGNSGGPLIDIRGRVVGINTAAFHGRHVSGINFAIPINVARSYARQAVQQTSNP